MKVHSCRSPLQSGSFSQLGCLGIHMMSNCHFFATHGISLIPRLGMKPICRWLLSKQKRHWVSLLVYFNHFMAPKAIYTETLCTISSWAMDPPGPTLEPPMHKPYISKPMLPYPSKLHKNGIDLSYHVICLMTSSFEFCRSY